MNFCRIICVILVTCYGLASCRPPERKNEPVPQQVSGVYVLNEGNFQVGNASISYRDEQSGQVTNDIFRAANGYDLGDVCQSMINIGPYYYVVVNASGRIEVVDTTSFKVVKTISGCQSPRYVLPVSAEKAYVSDFLANRLNILNLTTNEITGSISIPTWTEGLVKYNNKVYVSAPYSKYVLIVDPLTDQVTDSIETGEGVSSMVMDKYDHLWLISNGVVGSPDPFLLKVNTARDEIVLQEELANPAGNLSISADKNNLYWLEQGVVILPVDSAVVKRTTIIPEGTHNWYALGVHPLSEDLYISDAYDYLRRSEIFIYSKEGVQKAKFDAGIIAGGFFFKKSGQ